MRNDQESAIKDPIRRVKSADGTEITARARGRGPALVLLPAGPGDAETTWHAVLPRLSERFTCYLLNTRGRGLSGDHRDVSPERHIEDISAFVESLEEPVGLVEWGSFVGAGWSLFAARRSAAVYGVATFDPLVIGVAGEDDAARLSGIFERTGALVAEGRLSEAAESFPADMAEQGFYTEADIAGRATEEFWRAATENIPTFFEEMDQATRGPDPSDPSELAKVPTPVLLLHGTHSHSINVELVHFVAEHLPHPRVQAVQGAGHFGPITHGEAVAQEIMRFFEDLRSAA